MTRIMSSSGSATPDVELRYQTLVDQVPAIVYMELEDPNGAEGTCVTFMSPQVEELLGYRPDDFIDDPTLWGRVLHPDDAERVSVENLNADVTGEPFDLEYRMIARDGSVRWFRDVSRLVEGQGERFWHGVLLDITRRYDALDAAREAELRYQGLVETLPAVVFIDAMNDAATNIYTSPQTLELTGYSVEDWKDDPDLWWKLVHPGDAEAVSAAQERHAQLKDHVFDEEYQMIRKDGRVIWVRDIASTVFDEDGTALFAQGLLMDVSARKEAEMVLEASMQRELAAAQELRAMDRSRSALLRTLSHDLREPITAFISGAATLELHGELLSVEERTEMLHTMRERAERMNEVISHLLDLDKLGEEIAQTAQHHVDLCALLEEVGRERGLDPSAFELDCEHAPVWADPDAVTWIVGQFLDNADRHAPDASVRLKVSLVEGGAEITVEDDGPGIPPGMEEAIFEPFRQGETRAASLGMGVGLAYAQRRAELQGGHIRVEAGATRGARFVLFLPA
jgi:PAS domain S-box-containing protein